jgi:GNAT superfamily N-acetyltransferase
LTRENALMSDIKLYVDGPFRVDVQRLNSWANVAISQAGLGNRAPSHIYGGAMRDRTRRDVEQWWRDVFDVHDELWSKVTVRHPHGLLGDFAGWYVAWRDAGVHVSAPSNADADDVASLAREAPLSLQAVEFWHAFAQQRGLTVIGPGVHRYLDEDPGPTDAVERVEPEELRALRDFVDEVDWDESGFGDGLAESGAVAFATAGGGAVLTDLAGAPRNIGLLVADEARGAGVGTMLGRAAASYAVTRHGYARWRSRDTNVPSCRAAQRLGFEPYATQLAVRSELSRA